ncbi:MAG TPA: hypothetical protein G4O15_01540 [Dehalococcoidia bacterium]|nr:hypothetical protein [Dehalococcoidia bacterium]
MSGEHKFYDYIDEGGNNIIEDWLNNEGRSAKANFIIRIELLAASPPRGFVDSVWQYPYVTPLTGQWEGFVEIRVKANNNQYRLIGKKVDRDILLVAWGYHDGKGWNTADTPSTAKERVDQMLNNPDKYRRDHEL